MRALAAAAGRRVGEGIDRARLLASGAITGVRHPGDALELGRGGCPGIIDGARLVREPLRVLALGCAPRFLLIAHL